MVCTLCEEKEFSAIIEWHRPVEERPLLICYECFSESFPSIEISNEEIRIKQNC